jgi:hypothetical protein
VKVKKWSIVVTATVEAENQEEAENAMLVMVDSAHIEESGVTMLRATVQDDDGAWAMAIHVDGINHGDHDEEPAPRHPYAVCPLCRERADEDGYCTEPGCPNEGKTVA